MYKQLVAPEYGGIDMFVGTVRQWTGEIETTKIEYSAYHPMAEKQLEKIAECNKKLEALERLKSEYGQPCMQEPTSYAKPRH